MSAFANRSQFSFLPISMIECMTTSPAQALSGALYKVLRSMVRLLIRHGVSYKTFSDVVRHVFVDVAEEEFALPGRKPSNARTAVLTGINRKDIANLKGRPHPLSNASLDAPNPAARVITAWLNDVRFHDIRGNPKSLLVEDQPTLCDSFTSLAKEYANDVPVRALIDELLRVEAVSREGNHLTLLVNAYVPIADLRENLRIFGTAASDLLNTMDHNISRERPGPFLQRTVSYNRISEAQLDTVRQRCRAESEALLSQVNEWLAELDEQEKPVIEKRNLFRIGVGVYYIEGASPDEGEKKL